MKAIASPAVSVVVPCFNGASTLSATLESLCAQTFAGWEALIVDDGSEDSSKALADDYARRDQRIRVVGQPNRGLAGARNTGIRETRGPWLIFLDADDLLRETMIERMLGRGREGVDIVHCGYCYSDADLKSFDWLVEARPCSNYFATLAHGNPFSCHSLLVRRSALEGTGTFDESLRHCHDWDLWARLARSGARFVSLPETLAVYRLLPVSLSRNAVTFFEAGREVIRRTHRRDPRVARPIGSHAEGCPCDMANAIRRWALICSAFAVVRGQVDEALTLLETPGGPGPTELGADDIRLFLHGLAFGAAVPIHRGRELRVAVSRGLLSLALAREERHGPPGAAVEFVTRVLAAFPGTTPQPTPNPAPATKSRLRRAASRVWASVSRRCGFFPS